MTILTAHSVVYLTATARIETTIPAFVSAAAKEGWRLETGVPARSGWPWAPAVRLSHLVAAEPSVALVWTIEQIDLATPFHDMAALHVTATGAQTIQVLPHGAVGVRAADAQLRIPFSPDAPATLSITDLIAGTSTMEIRVGNASGQALTRPSGRTVLDLRATGIQTAPSVPAPFAGPIAMSMRLAARNAACSSEGDPAPSASSPVGLTAFEMAWGPARVAGIGTGRLDENCQPSGRATLRVKGASQLIDAWSKAGLIAPGPASAARAVLGLLTLAAGGEPITLPVALVDRTLSVAQFPLLRLPAIDSTQP